MEVGQKWQYGMKGMGYKVSPSQMHSPGAGYLNGSMYEKFR